MRRISVLYVILVVAAAQVALAGIPQTISYQGVLRDGEWILVPDGDYEMTFRLYNTETEGTPLWTEIDLVTVERGVFNVILGKQEPLDLSFDETYWLSVEVEAGGELAPRVELAASPYGFRAAVADSAGVVHWSGLAGVPAGFADGVDDVGGAGDGHSLDASDGDPQDAVYVDAEGYVGIGTQTPMVPLHIVDGGAPLLYVDGAGSADPKFYLRGGVECSRIQSSKDLRFEFWDSGWTDQITMTEAGNVGIGTTSPGAPLHIRCYNILPELVVEETRSGSAAQIDMVNLQRTWSLVSDSSPDYFSIMDGAGAHRMTIASDGKLGVGITSPNEKLTVQGVLSLDETSAPSATSGYGKIYVKSTDSKLYFKTDGGTEYNLTSTGGGGSVTSVSSGTGITCTPNPITTSGTVAFNQSWGDDRYVEEGESNIITPGMIHTGGAGNGEALMYDNGVTWGHPVAEALVLPYAANTSSGSIALDITSNSTYSDEPVIFGERASHDYYGIGVKGVGGWRGVEGVVDGDTYGEYTGVHGYASGSTGSDVYGVYGEASGDGTSFKAGVYGTASSGHAGFFSGYLYATSASATIKAFKIDHPLDPANKYLYHSSVESPDMMNVYNGNVVLDTRGEAWVDLPEWFEVLNREFRYQLTCIGGFAPVYIAERISGNRFKIAGGEAGMEVSWQVTGIRQDPAAEAHRVAVEEEKPVGERGKYLLPGVYNMPESMGIGYVAREKTPQ